MIAPWRDIANRVLGVYAAVVAPLKALLGYSWPCVPVSDCICARARDLAKYDAAGFKREYQALSSVGADAAAEASTLPANASKNRYTNISAYDHTRVVLPLLSTGDGSPVMGSDYINANYIRDPYAAAAAPPRYIACQGPVPDMFEDFWRMVWEVNARVVAMVTREEENGRSKCDRYWPDSTSTPPQPRLKYGDIVVSIEDTADHDGYTRRTFTLFRGSDTRTVHHMLFNAWPPTGVPDTPHAMLAFRCAVHSDQAASPGPLIVHCSAGVGRTGVFIGIALALPVARSTANFASLRMHSTL